MFHRTRGKGLKHSHHQSSCTNHGRVYASRRNMTSIHLPVCCGVMLLPDCTLFPHGGLPLHIFEPRYRSMLRDALEGDCFFAVARITGKQQADLSRCTAPVGTIGLVRACREMEDGNYQLLLHGVMRVRFTRWRNERDYPFADIEPVISYFDPPEQSGAAMKTLRGSVEDAIRGLPDEVQNNVLSLLDRAEDPALMSDIICQQFIHDPDLRQKLLETPSIGDRIPVICDFLIKASSQTGE